MILEGFFQSDRYSNHFSRLTNISNSVLVHMFADDAVLKSRYESRTLQDVRHWIHGDRENLPSLTPDLPAYMAELLDLDIPQVIIDTSQQAVDVSATARLILRKLSSEPSEQLA